MTLDESAISKALHDATSHLSAGSELVASVRVGGTRRLRRRRIGASLGVAAVVGAVVPVAIAVASGPANRETVSVLGGAASFPPARSCEGIPSDSGGPAAPSSYPQLLMLPPDQRVTYAFTNTGGAPRCAYFPHVALTLLHEAGGVVTRGVEVDGPDAPNTAQDGWDDGSQFSGLTLHPRVDGHRATVLYIPQVRSANVYWTGSVHDQWHATFRGLRQHELISVLHTLTFDPQTGTATLPGAAADGWTVAPPAPDASNNESGVFYALWHESGSKVALWIAQGPNRINQDAAAGHGARFVTVHGSPGVVGQPGDTNLQWQISSNLTAHMTMTHSTQAEIEQVAASLVPISPTDPRLHRP